VVAQAIADRECKPWHCCPPPVVADDRPIEQLVADLGETAARRAELESRERRLRELIRARTEDLKARMDRLGAGGNPGPSPAGDPY
jgi:hypothetical protein